MSILITVAHLSAMLYNKLMRKNNPLRLQHVYHIYYPAIISSRNVFYRLLENFEQEKDTTQ